MSAANISRPVRINSDDGQGYYGLKGVVVSFINDYGLLYEIYFPDNSLPDHYFSPDEFEYID